MENRNGTHCATDTATGGASTDANAEVVTELPRHHNHFGQGITCNMSTFFRHPCFWILCGVAVTLGVQAYNQSQRRRSRDD